MRILVVSEGADHLFRASEMCSGVQYYEGLLTFPSRRHDIYTRAIALSTYYLLPIVDRDFLGSYRNVFQSEFFSAGSPALCCVLAHPVTRWTVVGPTNSEPIPVRLGKPNAPQLTAEGQRSQLSDALRMATGIPGQPPPPVPPSTPTGGSVPPATTLTVSTTTTGMEGFLRFTFRTPDPRVNSATGHVSPQTYCSPYLDGQKIASGFEAVGRFALPVPLPYRHVILLTPPAGTAVDIGTVAPNFHQAGGGVEAFFPTGFVNANLHYHMLPPY
jgi:hypothetical protein